ncbi:MAG: YwqJ-related putative deaminase [Myxococcota bacterium]
MAGPGGVSNGGSSTNRTANPETRTQDTTKTRTSDTTSAKTTETKKTDEGGETTFERTSTASALGGGIAATEAVHVKNDAKARAAAQAETDATVADNRAVRDQLNRDVVAAEAELKRATEVRDAATTKAERKRLSADVKSAKTRLLDARRAANVDLPPVAAAVVDGQTGQTFTARNGELPSNPHPLIADRVKRLQANPKHYSAPGTHAEVIALDKALKAREARLGRPLAKSDLNSMTLDVRWTESNPKQRMVPNQDAPRCANCADITDGVRNLAGDAKPNRYAQAQRQSFRRGAVAGAAIGLGSSTYNALKDGKITGAEAASIATDTAAMAGAGAVGEVVEGAVARSIDAAKGVGLQRAAGATTRVAASRLGGAGAAGALISAGFSSADNIAAYNRGEITGAEAAGNIAGDVVVGTSAAVAGAAAGAAIGSIIPGAGTVVGAAAGFVGGAVVGYATDAVMRAGGVDKLVANTVTGAIEGVGSAVESVGSALSNAGKSLASVFGW